MGFLLTSPFMPTYPNPAFGADVFVYPTDHLYFGAGVFDGATQEGIHTGGRGPATLFGPPADLYVIGEAGVTWTIGAAKLPGRLRAGAWHQTGTFEGPGGDTADGTTGQYVTLDQRVWKENPGAGDADAQGVAAFVQIDWADQSVLPVACHASSGLVWTGALPGRDFDAVGVGATWAHLTDDPAAGLGGDEVTLDAFYRIQFTPYFSIKPDLQYVVNPGGGGLDDALVASVRLELAF